MSKVHTHRPASNNPGARRAWDEIQARFVGHKLKEMKYMPVGRVPDLYDSSRWVAIICPFYDTVSTPDPNNPSGEQVYYHRSA